MTHRFGQHIRDLLGAAHNMADHAGDATLDGEDYYGGPLNLAAGTARIVAFGEPRAIRHVMIGNGPLPNHTPGARLGVEWRDGAGEWHEAVRAPMTFGDDLHGLPLAIDLGPGVTLDAVRIEADQPASLSFLALFGPEEPPAGVRFVATRFDGLCQRLSTLLNAAILAEVTGESFGFTWIDADLPEIDQQANDDLSQLFTPEFIARHRVRVDDLRPGMPHYINQRHSEAQFDWLMAAARDHGVFHVDRPGNLRDMFPHLADRLPPGTDARVFDGLGFTPRVRAALDLGHGIELPEEAVGLHLRAGDIVHGSHSNHGGYLHKAVSIFEAEGAAEQTGKNGRPLVLVGQEGRFCDALAARFDHVTSTAYLARDHALTPLQSVLLDLTIMSRMRRIWAAPSAVSQLSMKIGEAKISHLRRGVFLPRPGIFRDDPFDGPDYAGVSPAYKAYSAIKTVWTTPINTWGRPHLAAVHYAIAKRPGIQFYYLLAATIEAALGRLDRAEEEAALALALDPPFAEWDVVTA